MLNYRKTTTLLSFLLLSTLVTSCGCGNKKGKERKQLVAKGKELTDKLKEKERKQLVTKEKGLTDKLKAQCKTEGGIWKMVEKDIKELKNDIAAIKQARTSIKAQLAKLEFLLPRIKQIELLSDEQKPAAIAAMQNQNIVEQIQLSEEDVRTYIETLGILRDTKLPTKNDDKLPLDDNDVALLLFCSNNITRVIQFGKDMIDLYDNLKKQAELKTKK
ncbi:hypothetical protein Aasi_0371 [Candidatus Amoebophilus asiaticus 5a2]|uniref:Lipoprotein n=1 Tax=Amoebophilus asiaticus (strain 5a2) TaxID=452471 RepID=B3ERE2_AMOA5|nr:hypothetical protein [Candidatus Amoebophilus asiaticus]ACE05794.1 hypothetical protein Aasi_0371 [Candidatus Amoebophilus asiaticus 5a2]